MAGKSDYLENKFIDWLLRGQAFTPPAVWIALFTSGPTDSGGGTEVTGGSYSRVQVVSSLANWAGTQGVGTTGISSGTGGQTSNNSTIIFPSPTADWGVCKYIGIFDAATSGNLLFWGELNPHIAINIGDPPAYFPPASLKLTED